MSLEYYLLPNRLRPESDQYMAVSRSPKTHTLEDLLEHMVREGSTITKAEGLAVFEEILLGIAGLISKGDSLNSPLVNIRPAIRGVFEGADDRFDPDRHRIALNITAGRRLKEVLDQVPTTRITAKKRIPAPRHYHDHHSGTRDEVITPARGARLTGTLLKFDESDQNQGIFFINLDEETETRVDSPILKNKPGELIFLNPALPPGYYRLEVRSKPRYVPEVRTGRLDKELSVT